MHMRIGQRHLLFSPLFLLGLSGCAATTGPQMQPASASDTTAASSAFLAGVAVRNIVPSPALVNNSIHSNMTVRFDEQGSPLKVKALALSFGEKSFMIVAIDNVVLREAHCDLMRQDVAAATGLSKDEIAICSSHSHSTPFAEALEGPHPYFDFMRERLREAAIEAWKVRRPARIGFGSTAIVGASFNTRVPQPDGTVKFTRDFREGLASGRPIDPRVTIMRVDDEHGKVIAGWICFATHPACVIFNTPISAEYPGYMTDRLSENFTGGAPVLFGFGAAGDSNCIPMFGKESDSRRLGHQLADVAGPVFKQIQTHIPKRLLSGTRSIPLPIDPPPSIESLDKDINEIDQFTAALDKDPTLEWVLGVNCKKDWTIEAKKKHVAPLKEWAERMKDAIKADRSFPSTWPSIVTALIIDDFGMVFYPGEPFIELGLALAARSPLSETRLVALTNGCNAYLGTDEDRRRAGYETYTVTRYDKLSEGNRPLPYAMGAGECMLSNSLKLIEDLLKQDAH